MASSEYSTSVVFRENDTGKLRIKGSVEIDDVAESPGDAADNAVAINLILQMLRDLGANADTDE